MNTTIENNKTNLATTTVSEIMTRSVQCIGMNDSISDALKIMKEGINSLPVVNYSGLCVGVLSRADLSEFLFEEDQHLARIIDSEGASCNVVGNPLDTCNEKLVRELMSDIVTLATERTTINEACLIMANSNIHHLPVTQNGKLVGIVSSLDIINWIAGLSE